jgi:pimeloyl-ACP methyl ester carboxylesterase
MKADHTTKIRSRDGTQIAYWQSGSGPSLSPALEETFTVYAIDRRGRGQSGDTIPYAIEREFEDVAAVTDSIQGPVNLVAHSYGAICSLEAALLTKNIAKLVLYEPPIPAGIDIYPPGASRRIQALVDKGDHDGAVATFFREIVRMPDQELEMLRALPVWQARVAAAHTLPREMLADEHYQFTPARFAKLNLPTLLLLGGKSPPLFKKAIELVHAALPNSRMVVMPGQEHATMNTAPELFTTEVMKFLLE